MLLEEYQSSPFDQSHAATDHSADTYELDPAYAQFRDQSRFWIQRVAVPMLMVIGLFGNLITVIIMTRRRMRSTTNMYLAALAFVDMLYLVLTFLLGLSHYPNMAANKYYAYWRLRPFLMMLTDACSNTSVWLTVTFTIERYIAVKYPMKGKVWCTEARAKMLIVFAFAFGILFASPVPFEWTVIEKRITPATDQQTSPSTKGQLSYQDASEPQSALHNMGNEGNNSTETDKKSESRNIEDYTLALDYSDFGRNETYKTIYYWSTAVIFYFVPLFSLMLFNGFLIKSVHHSKRERRRMTRTAVSSMPTSAQIDAKALTLGSDQPLDQNPPESNKFMNIGYRKKFKLLLTTSKPKMNCVMDDSSTLDESRQNCIATEQSEIDGNDSKLGEIDAPNVQEGLKFPTQIYLDQRISFIDNNLIVSQQTLDKNDESDSPNGFNVQNDCDHGFVTQTEEQANDAKNDQSIVLTEVSILERKNGSKNQKATVNANGRMGTRSTPFRRSQITNASSRSLHSIAPVSSQERRITIMLIAVVILFLVCQIPSAAMILYQSVNEPEPNTNEHALVLAFGNIFNFLMAVNAAGNFILYSFLSKKYRRTFIILFCSCFGSKANTLEARRMLGSRYESSSQSIRNHNASMYQSHRSVKLRRDTQV